MSQISKAPLSLSDCLCQICMEIFLEPVTLPCSHTLCNSCFQLTVEKASLCCPFCRRRVSSWARYNARRNTLVNWELWEKIQKNYPEECERRISGQDLEEEIVFTPKPQHQLSKPGELRQEYEAEISKVEAERRAHEQEENKASEEFIQRLLAEEEQERRAAEQRRRDVEQQLKQDEELAWQLSNSLNEDAEGLVLNSLSPAHGLSPQTSPAHLGKAKSKANSSEDIQKYLSPKSHSTSGSASFSCTTGGGRGYSGSVTKSSEGSSSVLQDDQEEMPTLSPQLTSINKDSGAKDLFLESCMNYFGATALGETTTVKQEKTPGPNCSGDGVPDALHGTTEGEGSGTALCRSKDEDDEYESNSGSLTHVVGDLDDMEPEGLQETPKRKLLETPADAMTVSGVLDKRRRTLAESAGAQGEQRNDFSLQTQRAFEQEFYERLRQEEQDRLLALQLQKELDKEERTLNRQKGSPDEYLLRTKPPRSTKDSSARKGSAKMAKGSKGSKKQAETHHHKTRRGACNENWQSPAKVWVKSPSIKEGKVLNCVVNTSDKSDICSLPKNKQKTILQMLKSPVA
ncbi:RN168 ligase, partial [Formicarius rufipectus]|nr:RN168 ligase [Formicarius rufipectus]